MASKQKNLGGRPTTYKVGFINEAKKYLELCKDELDIVMSQEVTSTRDINADLSLSETKITKVGLPNIKLPSIEGLAKYIGVSRSNIYKWRDEHPMFSDILEQILEEQADRLINMGLAGRYNGTITKLLLAKHGYIEKQEVDNNLKGELTIGGILQNIQGLNKNN